MFKTNYIQNQSALRVEGQKHRLFPQSHFVDGIEPRAPKGASAKMCLCMYFHDLACASKQPTSRFQCLKPARLQVSDIEFLKLVAFKRRQDHDNTRTNTFSQKHLSVL